MTIRNDCCNFYVLMFFVRCSIGNVFFLFRFIHVFCWIFCRLRISGLNVVPVKSACHNCLIKMKGILNPNLNVIIDTIQEFLK